MTFESDYEFMNKMVKMFKIGDNANNTKNTVQRTGSIHQANNSNLERDKLTAKMISKVIQRTASITTSTNKKVDEVGLLQNYLSRLHS